jgi:hypothetical protein
MFLYYKTLRQQSRHLFDGHSFTPYLWQIVSAVTR